MKKRILSAFIVMIIAVTMGESTYQWNRNKGQIYLYGEAHAESELIEREYDLWYKYYHEDGMRHLFIEAPYYDAEFLNLWMQSGSDELLEQMRIEQIGTSGASSVSNEFYKKIKRECPETIFHGTDVGHQYDTTGERYLDYLEETGPVSYTHLRAHET